MINKADYDDLPFDDWPGNLERIGVVGYYDYGFHMVGAFYDRDTGAYVLADTNGCSCYSPWVDDTTVTRRYYSKREAIEGLHLYRNDWGTGFRLEDINELAGKVHEHEH